MALQHLQLEVPDQHSESNYYATALQAMDGGIMPHAYELRYILIDGSSRTLRWCKFVG